VSRGDYSCSVVLVPRADIPSRNLYIFTSQMTVSRIAPWPKMFSDRQKEIYRPERETDH
jgi:hypothetical protein